MPTNISYNSKNLKVSVGSVSKITGGVEMTDSQQTSLVEVTGKTVTILRRAGELAEEATRGGSQ